MESSAWDQLIRQHLQTLADGNLHRQRRLVRPIDATHIEVDGHRYVNFASNNYLGLSHHPRVIDAAVEALRRYGAGAGASPLVTGQGPAQDAAERRIAAWKQCEAAVLLPSGYQANLAAVQTLASLGIAAPGIRFLLDKLVHASLVDAVRQSGMPFRVFPHNHLGKLDRLLSEAPADQLQVVVTESIFSMDGNAADLPGLSELKVRHGFVLLLDEAHASGVYGPAGAGLAAAMGLPGLADLTVITLSKALGCTGGAVCGSAVLCDAVVNLGRACIYSTGVAPAVAAAAEAAVTIMGNEPARRQRLNQISTSVRQRLKNSPFHVPQGDSPIVPLIVGTEEAALTAASRLKDAGLWVVPIRPPTVPRGTSRLRITLSSEHSDDEIERLLSSVLTLEEPMLLE